MADFETDTLLRKGNSTLGLTTTVKDQVENIQINIEHFRKSIDIQRKSQSEIQFQLKKLEELTLMHFEELDKEITYRINYLNQVTYWDNNPNANFSVYQAQAFKNEHNAEENELNNLELQNNILSEEHKKLTELGDVLEGRVERTEANVGV